MFLRSSKTGGHTYLRLVEAFRTPDGKVAHRQIAQLGRADQLAPGSVDALIRSLARHTGRPIPTDEDAARPEFLPARDFGALWALHELWHSLGLDVAIARALRSSRRAFAIEPLIRTMVFNRLTDPDSKLGVLRWLDEVRVPKLDAEQVTHQRLLRAMDALMDGRSAVETAVAAQLKPLIDRQLSVVFYDLTTVRIHGTLEQSDDLRQFGFSKDVEGTARQFVLGLIQTAEGLPIAHEVFEGNIAETKTFAPMLKACLARYPIERVIVVADRGVLSYDNLEALERLDLATGSETPEGTAPKRPLQYILAVPARRYGELYAKVEALTFPDDAPSVRETTFDQRRLVVAHDPLAAAEQTRRRRERIDALLAEGDRLAKRLDDQDAGKKLRGRTARDRNAYARFARAIIDAELSRFVRADYEAELFSFAERDDEIAKAERLDGKLLLATNVDGLAADAVVARYKALADIERGFRVLKSDLEIAPVYHRLPERIRAHALICFLALVLHRIMRQRLKRAGRNESVDRALSQLRRIQEHTVQFGERTVIGISQPTPQQSELFAALGIKPPARDPA
jgi:transposase